MHVKEAEQRIAGEIPWLCDSIGNDVMHALGNAPTSEFVIDPDGKIVRKRAWGNARELRKDLEKLAGPVEKPTRRRRSGCEDCSAAQGGGSRRGRADQGAQQHEAAGYQPGVKRRRHSALREAPRRHGRTVVEQWKGKTVPWLPPRSDLPSSLEQLDRTDSRGDRIAPGRRDAQVAGRTQGREGIRRRSARVSCRREWLDFRRAASFDGSLLRLLGRAGVLRPRHTALHDPSQVGYRQRLGKRPNRPHRIIPARQAQDR